MKQKAILKDGFSVLLKCALINYAGILYNKISAVQVCDVPHLAGFRYAQQRIELWTEWHNEDAMKNQYRFKKTQDKKIISVKTNQAMFLQLNQHPATPYI